jgi:uncharacterized protein (DUF2147 family)
VFNFFAFVLLFNITSGVDTIPPSELICGKWESFEKNLIVQVYMYENRFRAKILWFNDGNLAKMDTWTDIRNPDPSLRSRKILGMEVLRDLTYNAENKSWEDGMIYDAKHGREWNASAHIDKNGLLKVKGYWHFKFIGRTLTFTRVY